VMQVLVALARADGAIVTRHELTMSCWDGRVVGEDAINRIISRLRASASGIGAGSFRLETVTKVGYRLLRDGQESETEPLPAPARTRRWLLGGGGAAAAAALAGGFFLWPQSVVPPAVSTAPADVAPLMQQAWLAIRQATREGHNQAIGLYQRVVTIEPNYADGWGALGIAYAFTARLRDRAESARLRERGHAAGQRALSLDPGNSYGAAAFALAMPMRGNWLTAERALRRAVAEHPQAEPLLFELALTLLAVGRTADSLPLLDRIRERGQPTPSVYFIQGGALWAAGRIDEADRLMAEAASLYPTHFAVWFTRFYLLLYSGRASAAVALAEDVASRPSNIPDAEVDEALRLARAVASGARAEIDGALAARMERAHLGTGYAEGALQAHAALGRIDAAFAIAEALYFGRGFVVPDVRFTRQQGTYSPPADRQTHHLFAAPTRGMRGDSRFAGLVSELGLTRYWQDSGSLPDYRRG
jgi:tetratricopeptide (TPR) repeat protein